jgi:hypothetical protein
MHVFDIFNQFATDPNLELEGVWHPIGPALRTLENGSPDPESVPQVKVARSQNKRHGRMLVALYEANKAILDAKDEAADKRNEEITGELMANTIFLGWKNLTFQGTPVPDGYDLDWAKKMMAVKDFRDLVNSLSNQQAPYRLIKEAAKN